MKKFAVYTKRPTSDKVGYVSAKDRASARDAAAVAFGGNPDDYFVAAAGR